METSASTITMRETLKLFLLASFSPAVRLATGICAKMGKQAGWVSIILSCLVYCGLILMLSAFFSGNRKRSLYNVYRVTVGRVGTGVISVIYLVWMFLLIALYVRAFAERYTSSILPNSPTEVFIVSILGLCYIFLSGSIKHFVKMTSIFYYIVFGSCIVILFSQFQDIKLATFFPVTTLDTVNILKATYPFLGTFCYITFLMFMGDEIDGKDELKHHGLRSAWVLLFINQIIFFVTIGVFGDKLTENLTLPFFMSVKMISLFNSLERLESLFIILWIITDVAIIMMLMYCFLRLAGKVFKVDKTDTLKNPMILGTYVFSLYFVDNIVEISEFSEKFALGVNIVLGFVVPAIVFVIYKIKLKMGYAV